MVPECTFLYFLGGTVVSRESCKLHEDARIKKLHEYRILDSDPEELFDQITNLTARLLNTPIALISLVDRDRQWIKSGTGTDLKQTARKISFCTHTINDDKVMVVENASRDKRFANNPLVTGKHSIRAYAGAPLRTNDGHNLGSLCAIDTRPRAFSHEETLILDELSALVVGHMEMCRLANRAIKAEQRLIDAVDALPDGLVFYDEEDRLVLCNQRYKEIYSESADLIVPGARFEDIIRGGVERGQYPEALGIEEEWIRERVTIHQNPGEPIEQELPGDRWLRIQEGRTSDGGRIGFRFDVTKLKRQERELTRMAWTDGLTGTLNRSRFTSLGEAEFGRSTSHEKSLALLVLDIDHFKQINDRFGHAAGDTVLVEIAERWRQSLRDHDLLGRLGGEEFGVLLPETDADGAIWVAEKLRMVTQASPVIHDKNPLDVTVSIGISLIEDHHKSMDDMMLAADNALYEVKRNGRNGFHMIAA